MSTLILRLGRPAWWRIVALGALLALSGVIGVPRAFADPRVVVTPSRLLPGQSVVVSGSGWAPHDQILVSFTDSTGTVIPLGVITADANGNFQRTITVPSTVPPGTYQIDGNGQGGSVTVTLTILAPSPTPAPPTPTLEPATPTPGLPTPRLTPSPTATATSTPSPTPSPSATPTATATPTFTPTPTSTPTPTNTPTLPERIVGAGQGAGLVGLTALVPLLAAGLYLLARRRT